MKKHLIICLAATLCLGEAAFAQGQRVIMKDNTVYEGYVQSQNFGGDTVRFVIAYTAFTKTFPTKAIISKTDKVLKGKDIPDAWLNWAKANNKIKIDNGQESLTLTSMSVQGAPSGDYYIIRDGSDDVQCHYIGNHAITVPYDMIYRMDKDLRDPTLLTDVNDVVTTTRTDKPSIIGTIVKQVPGKSIVIWDSESGKEYEIKNSQILSTGKQPINSDCPIWEQSPYLNRIQSSQGMVNEGIIVEQTIASKGNRTIRLQTKNGIYPYQMEDVEIIQTVPNMEYKPIYDIILEPGKAMVNRDTTITFSNILKMDINGFGILYYLDPKILKDQPTEKKLFSKDKTVKTEEFKPVTLTAGEVVIETNNPDIDIDKIRMVKAVEKKLNLVPKKDPLSVLTFTANDIFEGDYKYKVSKDVSINGTTKISFSMPEPGYYFILPDYEKAWVIQYKKKE